MEYNTVTKADFLIFKKEAEKWINMFGLHDWEIEISQSEKDKDKLASSSTMLLSKRATIAIGHVWSELEAKTPESLRATAFHEVAHLLLARLRTCGLSRFVTHDEFSESEHGVINRLDHVLRMGKLLT